MSTPMRNHQKSTTQLCVRLDNSAYAFLRSQVATKYGLGRYVSRLIHEHIIREEAKQPQESRMYRVPSDFEQK